MESSQSTAVELRPRKPHSVFFCCAFSGSSSKSLVELEITLDLPFFNEFQNPITPSSGRMRDSEPGKIFIGGLNYVTTDGEADIFYFSRFFRQSYQFSRILPCF